MAETARVFKVSNNKFKFGTKGLESADADMMMPKDLTSFSFQGKRSVGDPGNDYIASLFMAMGSDAMTKFEWEMVSGAKLAFDCVINVTTPGGGDTAALDALEFEVVCYGKPVFTPAAPAA